MIRAIKVVLVFAGLVVLLPVTAQASENFAPTIPLVVNEALPGFVTPQRTIEIPQGMVKFITLVPSTATGQHGIGIDGGPYKDIMGAPVKPGRSSSLTVEVSPGDYTVFDSFKDNRAKGYFVKVHVTKAKAKHVSYGKLCRGTRGNFYYNGIWVKDVSCRSALKLIGEVQDIWQDDNDFSYAPITANGFSCFITPFSLVGLKFSCLADGGRVTFIG